MLTQKKQFSADKNGAYALGDIDKFCVQLNRNGQLLCASAGDVLLSRTLGNGVEGGLGRLFLRVHVADSIQWHVLLGPAAALSNFACEGQLAQWHGAVAGCEVQVSLRVDVEAATMLWEVHVTNQSAEVLRMDTVWVQDIGLATRGALLCNEAYTAHYVDESVLEDDTCGPVLSFRQNLPQASQHPWLMAACLTGAASYATDAFDVYGNGYRCGEDAICLQQATLSNRRYQYEFSCAALQARTVDLERGTRTRFAYAASYVADHPAASSAADRPVLESMYALAERSLAHNQTLHTQPLVAANLVVRTELAHGRDLSQAELQEWFPAKWRHVEHRDGTLMSFFCDADTHVVTRAKEAAVERPHGTILVGNADQESLREVLATTVYMYGVFTAQTVYGNTSFHKMNSLPREPLGLSRTSGMRIYFESDTGWRMLGTPSAFAMTRDACRWIYVLDGETITVHVALSGDRDAFKISVQTHSSARRFMVSNELIMGSAESDLQASLEVNTTERILTLRDLAKQLPAERGIQLAFGMHWSDASAVEIIGGAELLEADGIDSLLVLRTAPTDQIELNLTASLQGPADVVEKLKAVNCAVDDGYWTRFNRGLNCSMELDSVARLRDALCWYSHNALIHYASPHGLEQYTGAAWGTRDACQGPFEYFIAQQHHGLARSILLKTFATQYADSGDWPQWFMHDEYFDIAQQHSHGDIVVWPLKALALYLSSTGDLDILNVHLPYLGADNRPADLVEPLTGHIEKTLNRIEHECIPGTALIRYGGGDWDDSLQPVSSDLAARLVSGWTVALLAQSLAELEVTLAESALRSRVADLSARVRADFRQHVLIDGAVAGFLLYDEALQSAEPLLHPQDTRTGTYNRLIPMTRSIIAGLLTREEADLQMRRIADHLQHPDGVRLMDRPMPYSGGLETFFKRAESAANFGREIGLQYVHAHIRYAEALAKLGDGDRFFKALLTICPVCIEQTVPNAAMRQSNMYFSSSDAAFLNRADAAANFDQLRDANVPVKGGWRLYSSGPGLYFGLVLRQLFGLRELANAWIFDPVLPKPLDGIVLTWELFEQSVQIVYHIKHACSGAQSIQCGGVALEATREMNPYRQGGLIVEKSVLKSALASDSRIIVTL